MGRARRTRGGIVRTETRASAGSFARLIFWIAVGAVFGWSAWLRLNLPLEPLADADTWGYLLPATKALTGEGFIHAGRNFIYPGFLYFVLRLSDDFRAIGLVQH